MPLIITPGQLRQRAEFYYQLAQLTAAGLAFTTALQQLQRSGPSPAYRRAISGLLDSVSEGYTVTESVRRLGTWAPAFDIALIHAGEQSGRLDATLRLLADYYQDRARILRQMLADLAYPAFLLHFAIFIFAFIHWFQSAPWTTLFAQTFGVLLPIYAVIALLIYAAQGRHSEAWRSWMESVLHPIPLLGTARRNLALARLAAALEALLSAGVSIVEAWELAGAASGSPALRRTILGWRPLVDAGKTPAEIVNSSSLFPPMFAGQYATGEYSGKLDETLRRLHNFYQDDGTRKLHAVTLWVPRFIYLAIVITIGYWIIQFYAGYFRQIGAAGGF